MNVGLKLLSSLIGKAQFPVSYNFTPLILPRRSYREIQATEDDDNVITIKGISHEVEGVSEAIRLNPEDPCPLRSRALQITPYDVLILNQFITSAGDVLTQEECGLSERNYYKVLSCVKMAQRANMLPGPESNTSLSPKGQPLNTYLTRYPIGTRSPIRGRNLWYRRNYYKVGDRRVMEDAPRVSTRRITDKH